MDKYCTCGFNSSDGSMHLSYCALNHNVIIDLISDIEMIREHRDRLLVFTSDAIKWREDKGDIQGIKNIIDKYWRSLYA